MTFPEFVESYTPYKENEILKLDDNILEILEEKYNKELEQKQEYEKKLSRKIKQTIIIYCICTVSDFCSFINAFRIMTKKLNSS